MSTDRDTTRLVRSWLDEGATALPDRVLDAVLDQVPATPQRRSWWPTRRSNRMSRTIQVIVAAAAVLVVAVVGYNLLPAQPSTIGGAPTPVPTVSPSPNAGVTPSATPAIPTGSLPPGTYTERSTAYTMAPFSFTVPAGWSYSDGNIFKGSNTQAAALSIDPWLVDHVFSDACQWHGAGVPVGPTQADLVAALVGQTGIKRTGPTNVTFGGLPAVQLVLSEATGKPASGCFDGILHIWPDVGGSESGGEPLASGSTQTIYVLDTDRHSTAFAVQRPKGTSAADLAELQSILDSVTFLP